MLEKACQQGNIVMSCVVKTQDYRSEPVHPFDKSAEPNKHCVSWQEALQHFVSAEI